MRNNDSQLIGFIFGIIGPLIGTVIYYFLQFSHVSFMEFIEVVLKAGKLSAVISLSTIFNLVVFFLFIWKNKPLSARGVILATFIYVLLVILVKFS